jgi:hypothetical protein
VLCQKHEYAIELIKIVVEAVFTIARMLLFATARSLVAPLLILRRLNKYFNYLSVCRSVRARPPISKAIIGNIASFA